ncbi:MAG: hypothetical protein R2722_07680 [Tessaracoccus sp.]
MSPHSDEREARQSAAADYRAQLREFARRGKIALAVRIVTSIVAVVMIGIGAVFVLSSITNVPGSHLAQRYIPGVDGSISIQVDGTYAVTNTDGPLLSARPQTATARRSPSPGSPSRATLPWPRISSTPRPETTW